MPLGALLVTVLYSESFLTFYVSEPPATLEQVERQLRNSEHSGDVSTQLSALNRIALLHMERGAMQQAIAAFERVVARSDGSQQAIRYAESRVVALSNLGILYRDISHDAKKSAEAFQKSHALAEQAHLDEVKTATQLNLSGAYFQQGDREAGMELLRKGMASARTKEEQAMGLHNLAVSYAEEGKRKESIQTYEQVLPLWESIGAKQQHARALFGLAEHYSALGQTERAGELAARALHEFEAVGDPLGQATVLTFQGKAYLAQRQYERAVTSFDAAVGPAQRTGDPVYQAKALGNLGRALTEVGRLPEAMEAEEKSAEMHAAAGNRAKAQDQLRAALSLARFAKQTAKEKQLQAKLDSLGP